MPNCNKRGVILFIVMGVIMVVAMMSIVILRIISNQSLQTYHQLTRIRAQYAAKSGLLYALDKLRRNDDATWPASGQYLKTMCRSACNINEPDLHPSIQQVDITVYAVGTGPVPGTRKVSAKATYLDTP